jgi:hypothetical protein
MVTLQDAGERYGLPPQRRCRPAKIQGRGLFVSDYDVWEVSPRSGMDSDLEAFSHYPADGSFAALPCQTAAKTNYLNQQGKTNLSHDGLNPAHVPYSIIPASAAAFPPRPRY